VLVRPSPKFHCQEVGVPVEVSKKLIVCPRTGVLGVYVKSAMSVEAGATMMLRLTLVELEALVTARIMLKVPATEKA
jgi:hypothetical protein